MCQKENKQEMPLPENETSEIGSFETPEVQDQGANDYNEILSILYIEGFFQVLLLVLVSVFELLEKILNKI